MATFLPQSATHTPPYAPVVGPPTPAPSPSPISELFHLGIDSTLEDDRSGCVNAPYSITAQFASLPPQERIAALSSIISLLNPVEIVTVQSLLAPLLKRDFLAELPLELALHIVSFLEEPKSLGTVALVSRQWNAVSMEDSVWRDMCARWDYGRAEDEDSPFDELHPGPSTWRGLWKYYYTSTQNWMSQPKLLRTHRLPTHTSEAGLNTITSSALSRTHLVVALANSRIHLFDAQTGAATRPLIGHDNGVWAVALVTAGGGLDPRHIPVPVPDLAFTPPEEVVPGLEALLKHNRVAAGHGVDNPERLDHLLTPSMRRALGLDVGLHYLDDDDNEHGEHRHRRQCAGPCGTARGWGQPGALVISGGSDRDVRVWDAETGLCLYVLRGHASTVRTLRVLHNRPVAISGARDGKIRVWDIKHGRLLRRLDGHQASVRALETYGNQVVSGSYDHTCRLWNVDTGQCLKIFRGHTDNIYCVAYDGTLVASGGVDTTVRVWDARSGECMAQLKVHTALVCQLVLAPSLLISGGADGRVMLYSFAEEHTLAGTSHLRSTVAHRIAAHDSSITALQLVCDGRLLVTAGNDGRTRLWDVATSRPARELGSASGKYVREMSDGGDGVWGINFRREGGAVLCKRQGKMVVEMWRFGPEP